uniref:hypothetical protein n=1 Tax=Actinomyces mediterranea TaxID=1871028 RepID=UPI00196857D6|nr:hypothetical protein [Actinomyces mediterranea]
MAALAVARYFQDATGMNIKKIIRTLRPLQDVTILINGNRLTTAPQFDPAVQTIIVALAH